VATGAGYRTRELSRGNRALVTYVINSEWVCREARAGLRKEALVPILLDQDAFPSEFAAIQATDLSHWKGETGSTQMEALLRRLARLVPPSRIDTVRPGYDPDFLGDDRRIPLPGVSGSVAVLRYLQSRSS
jgi:hypothetical protein